MHFIEIKEISKIFNDNIRVLDDINLSIEKGQFIVLVGSSGCGKSTLLRIISGLENQTSGQIFVNDECVDSQDPSKRDMAMVFQNYALYPHMTVRENLSFSLKINKHSEDIINQKVENAANILKIENLLNRRPKELSGGQRQRVALGRAIVRDPKVFLFDEPLSNLDAKLRSEMRVEIKKIHQLTNGTMIYVTHDQVEALTMGDKIAVMHNGVVEQFDTPDNIYNKPVSQYVASFIGSPEINFIDGKITKDNDSIIFLNDLISFSVSEKHPQVMQCLEKEVIVGIRPHDVYDNYFSEYKNKLTTVNAKINLIENLGNNSIVYIDANGLLLTILVDNKSKFEINKNYDFIIDSDKVIFFDKKTSKYI